MARDILSEYGPESRGESHVSNLKGGVERARDVHNYSPPKGPLNINDSQSPGLHGSNLGNCGTQGCHDMGARSSGSPGLHGTNKGNRGTQR